MAGPGGVRAAARRSAMFDLVLAVITTGVEIGLLFDDGPRSA
ncbi:MULTISPECIES: hypothetical protein [unclassified Streptomyces]|nr:hypothetical protein [Streptomyces sp. CB09001]